MSDLEQAKGLFGASGLAFPTIPAELSHRLREQSKWLYTTRRVVETPYILDRYVRGSKNSRLKNYALICHDGHGINSYAIHYYLVRQPLQMFLQLAWGGVYMDNAKASANVASCFALADEIVFAASKTRRLSAGQRITIVASEFYGLYWLSPGERRAEEHQGSQELLREVLQWLKKSKLMQGV